MRTNEITMKHAGSKWMTMALERAKLRKYTGEVYVKWETD